MGFAEKFGANTRPVARESLAVEQPPIAPALPAYYIMGFSYVIRVPTLQLGFSLADSPP